MRDSALQFELKKVFVLVTGAAILFVVLAPLIRAWEPERQYYALQMLLLVATVAGITLATTVYLRYRVERKCGPLLVRLWLSARRARLIRHWVMLICVGFLAVSLFLFPPLGAAANGLRTVIATNYLLCFTVGIQLAQAILQAWWQRMETVELCENGIISGGLGFYTWASLRHVRWNPEKGKLNLGTARSPIIITVPAEQRDAVTQIVTQKRPECASALPA